MILALVPTGVVVGSMMDAGMGLVKHLADLYNQYPELRNDMSTVLPKAN